MARLAAIVAAEAPLPAQLHCQLPRCTRPWTHTSEAHHCAMCGVRMCAACGPRPSRPASPTPRQVAAIDLTVDDNGSDEEHTCPICRRRGPLLPGHVFAAAECSICMEQKPLVVFEACRHACACAACAARC